ncbi:MAG: flagellar motor switch protein FliG [Acidobacteria bacterium]|nr:flagellar motor switch protein FliG [Acidobacteriota bacterium]MBI3663012.1 flagellar motor switch protein FliG [Acidobacteriota bacterium]
MRAADDSTMTGVRKAAVLLVILGDDVASNVFKSMPEREVHKLTHEIAELEYVSPEMAIVVLEEYNRLALTQEYVSQGGADYASKLLVKAFGEEAAKSLLDQVVQAQVVGDGNFEYLQKADPIQLAKFVEKEHPQTIALVIAHLGVKSATAVLGLLPEKIRAAAMARLAGMRQFSPDVAQKISMVLHKRLLSLGDQNRRAYSGVKAVATLLNEMDINVGKSILEVIEQENANLSLAIRNLMFTFEDFLTVSEVGIRELLGQVDKKQLAISLKNASEELKNHFFKSMSSRAVDMLKEDMEVLGPMRSRDVNKAQVEIIELARKLESQGKIVLKSDREELVV